MVAASAQLPPRPCPPLAPGAELPKPAPAHLAPFMGSSSFSNAMAQPNMAGGPSLSFLSGLGEQPMSPVSPLTLVPLAALPPLNMTAQQNGDVAGFMQLQQTLVQMQQMSSPLSGGAPPNTPMMPLTPTSNTAVSVAAQQLQQLQQAQLHLQQMAQAQQAQLLQLQVTAGLPFMVQLIGAIQAHPPLLLIEELAFLRDFLAAQGVDIHRYGGSNPPTPIATPVSTTATAGSSFPATSPVTSNPPTPVTVTSSLPSSVGFVGRLEVPHEGMRGATPDSQASESTQGLSSCDASSRASTPACNQFGLEMNPFLPFDVPSSISACWDSPRSNANASPVEGLRMQVQSMMHTPNSSAPTAPVVKPSPQRPTTSAGMKLKVSQVPSSVAAPADLFGEAVSVDADGDSKDKALIDPRKYKTRMCRNWMQTGACSYEHACCFAHGEAELRDPAANVVVLSSLGYFTTKRLRDGQ